MLLKAERFKIAQLPLLHLAATVVLTGVMHGAFAQVAAADDDRLQEIVVTAEKRSEKLQDVPISIDAVTSAQLEMSGVTRSGDLAQVVPGLIMQQSMNGTEPHIRGVGTTAVFGEENSVATYVDGVYRLGLTGALAQLNDVDQVEVLKGPQGTLFGRNATGGVISIKTKDPVQTFSGDAGLSYGNYNTETGDFYLTGGLTDNLAASVSGYESVQGDGFGKNLYNGEDVGLVDQYAGRTKLLYTPNDNDKIRLIADWSRYTGTPSWTLFRLLSGYPANYGPGTTTAAQRPDLLPYILSGAIPASLVVGNPYSFQGGFHDISSYQQPEEDASDYGLSAEWDHQSDSFTFTSISAFRWGTKHHLFDSPPLPADRLNVGWTDQNRQFTQEFQVGSPVGSTIPWVAGLYGLIGRGGYPDFYLTGSAVAPTDETVFHATIPTDSAAAFAQTTIPVAPKTDLTLGLRYTVDRRGVDGDIQLITAGQPDVFVSPTHASATWRSPTWRISLDRKLTDDILTYVSYNRGFKSGLFNTIPPGGPDAQPVKPETIDAFEAGLKSDWLERRLRLNVAAFLYEYRDLQVSVHTTESGLIENGAKAQIYGIDIDTEAEPVRNLHLNAGVSVMHSEFQSYPHAQIIIPQTEAEGGGNTVTYGSVAGNELPMSPSFTGNITADYGIPFSRGRIDFDLNYHYNGLFYPEPDNVLRQPGYGLVNAKVDWTLPNGRTELGLWGRNLTNKDYYSWMLGQGNPGGASMGTLGDPRTYGVSIRYKF